jgi:hypothetical protein
MRKRVLAVLVVFILGIACVSLAMGVAAYRANAMPLLPSWKQVNEDGFGDPANGQVPALAVMNDYIYAGVQHWDGLNSSSEIWRTSTGEDWEMVDARIASATGAMGTFKNSIYAGSWDGYVWSSADGTTWTEGIRLVSGEGQGIAHFAEYADALYVGTWMAGVQIWRTTNGTDWEPFVPDGLGDENNIGAIASAPFDGQLYWGVMNFTTGAQLWRTDGITMTAVITDGFGTPLNYVISSLAEFDSMLYAGVINNPDSQEVQVWRSPNGEDWDQVVNGFEVPRLNAINSLEVFDGKLYLVVQNDLTGVEVWRTSNGTDWEQVGFSGFGDANNLLSYWDNATITFKNNLYIATTNFVTGGEVWQMTAEPAVVPPASVLITGPTEGLTGQSYEFSAIVEPVSTTLPITYTWQATGQAPITHTNGLEDMVQFTWEMSGQQTITVTASNTGGAVMDTHVITLASLPKEYEQFLPCVLKACKLTISDDFSNPSSGWETIQETYYGMRYANGQYEMTASPGWIVWSTMDFGVNNYKVDVDAFINSGSDGGTGIIFGSVDGFYLYEISEGYFGLWRVDGDSFTWTTLINWTKSSAILPYYQTNHMTMDRQGAAITLYVNGQRLGSVNDSTYQGPYVGMAVETYNYYVDAFFDNFKLNASSCLNIGLGLNARHLVQGYEISVPNRP